MAKQKIYIKEIELENIESHEHTVLKDFSQGFNCIAGLSDVGKTTVIRAVKLCAYNEFDQKMVRTGADFCRVKITTNIGSVEVKKGPNVNLWVVKRNDTVGEIKLDKVGKAEVKQACEVLGMKVITLGETEVPINIMDQLERHFFIDGIGDKKTTGSSRAEIIDEICGLNGAEELIRTISLDQYRLTREITEAENRMKELEGKMFSEVDILRDQMLLASVEKIEEEIETCKTNISYLNGILETYTERLSKIEEIDGRLDGIRNYEEVEDLIRDALVWLKKADRIKSLYLPYQKLSVDLKKVSDTLSSIPDINIDLNDVKSSLVVVKKMQELSTKQQRIASGLKDNQEGLDKMPCLDVDLSFGKDVTYVGKLQDFLQKHTGISSRLLEIGARLSSVSGKEESETILEDCRNLIQKHQKLVKIHFAYADPLQGTLGQIRAVASKIEKTEKDLVDSEKKLSEIYRNITICPVTKMPIGDVCSLLKERK